MTAVRMGTGTGPFPAGGGKASRLASALTACFLALAVFAGLRLVAVEVWRNHPYDFLGAWVPVTAMSLLATWHLATAGMPPLWLFGAFEAALAVDGSVLQGRPDTARLVAAALVLGWVATLARNPRLRPVRAPSRSVLAVVGLGMVAAVTCYGAWQFGLGVFSPWTEYPRWSEEPGAREGLDRVSVGFVREAVAMDGSRSTLTYVIMPWDPSRRLTHGQADYLAHGLFCRDMSGAARDGTVSFDFEFVDQASAPLGTATMTAAACRR